MQIAQADTVFAETGSYLVHVVRAGAAYDHLLHSHRGFSEIVYVQDGHFAEVINGREYSQKEGTLTLIRESDKHVISGRHFTFTNVAFRSSWWQQLARLWDDRGLIDRLLSSPHPPTSRIPEDQRSALEAELRRLMSAQGDVSSRLPFSRFLISVLNDHLLAPAPEPERAISGCPSWLAEALLWASDRSEGVPSLPELLGRCGRCREHVARSFRKHLGLTPSQFLNRERLKRAVVLLKQTNYPVLNVSYDVGFDSPTYFHKLFKEVYGTTPRQYRMRFGYHPPERQ